jgi:hypothetical protein
MIKNDFVNIQKKVRMHLMICVCITGSIRDDLSFIFNRAFLGHQTFWHCKCTR